MGSKRRGQTTTAREWLACLGTCALMVLVGATVLGPMSTRQQFSSYQILGQAMNAYASDHDDNLPLSMSFNSIEGRWRTGQYAAIPAGSATTGARHIQPRKTEEQSYALNSTFSYHRRTDVFQDPNLTLYDPLPQANGAFRLIRPYSVNVNFNGLLHAWNVNAVTTPTRTPLLSQNYGANLLGMGIANPVICCTVAQNTSCQFNPTGYPQPGQTSCAYHGQGYGDVWFLTVRREYFTTWIYGQSMVFASVDTSVRLVETVAPFWPNYIENVQTTPWSSLDPDKLYPSGTPYWATWCTEPGGDKTRPGRVYYKGYFRPDSEFNYTSQQCDFGGG